MIEIRRTASTVFINISHQMATFSHCLANRIALIFTTIIQALQNAVNSIAIFTRGFTVKVALYCGYLRIVHDLIRGPISEYDRGQAVRLAADQGHCAVVRALLDQGPISEDDREEIMHRAVKHKNLNIFNTLLTYRPISDNLRRSIITLAVEKGATAIVLSLVNNSPFPENFRGIAVEMAAYYSNFELVKILLANGLIPKFDRGEALWWAAMRGNLDIVKFLLKNGSIYDLAIISAIREASKTDNLKMIKKIIEINGPLTKFWRIPDIIQYIVNIIQKDLEAKAITFSIKDLKKHCEDLLAAEAPKLHMQPHFQPYFFTQNQQKCIAVIKHLDRTGENPKLAQILDLVASKGF